MLSAKQEKFTDLVVYQIYPKSFCDSNGDGIGDIKGIIGKLDYIKELGANAIWICPIYASPQCDNGYDISDYRAIDGMFGTMRDFEELVSVAHSKGIKVIMDLVANHTSSEHFWFKEARRSRDNRFHDYYYWSETPPNDWQSCFGESTWECNEQTNEYYLHSFAKGQPDVNWTNPEVRKEFCDIVDFWVNKGVDGFRCDVFDMISKELDKPNGNGNGPKLHEYIRELFGRPSVENVFTVGECWGANIENIKLLCGENRKELKSSFQFDHLGTGDNRWVKSRFSMNDCATILSKWQTVTQENDILYTLFTDNHDQPFFNSRIGNDVAYRYQSATMIATMVFLMRGIPFIYQGQEIGCANSEYNEISYFDDVETLNFYNSYSGKTDKDELMKRINFGNRDNSRRPFAWNGKRGFGFTDAESPWLPYGSRSSEINVESDLKSKNSVLKYYRELFSLRNGTKAFRCGAFKDITDDKGYIAYIREYENEKYLVICNFEDKNKINFCETLNIDQIVLSNTGRKNIDGYTFDPYESLVCKLY